MLHPSVLLAGVIMEAISELPTWQVTASLVALALIDFMEHERLHVSFPETPHPGSEVMGMGGQKQYDVFITQRKRANYAEHQCCTPNCHWHQLLRHEVAKSLGQYLLFWNWSHQEK